MDQFLINVSSFPVSVYSVGVIVVIGYWMIALVGLFDIEFMSAEVEFEIDTEVSQIGSIAGMLTTLGLSGVPITIVISLLILNGWIICYFISKLVPDFFEALYWIEIALNFGVVIVSFMLSILATAPMVKPLRKMFNKINNEPISRSAIGSTCRVRSTRLDEQFGEVECVHQGASLILKARSYSGACFTTGDSVILVEHNKESNYFLVVSEEKFNKELE